MLTCKPGNTGKKKKNKQKRGDVKMKKIMYFTKIKYIASFFRTSMTAFKGTFIVLGKNISVFND